MSSSLFVSLRLAWRAPAATTRRLFSSSSPFLLAKFLRLGSPMAPIVRAWLHWLGRSLSAGHESHNSAAFDASAISSQRLSDLRIPELKLYHFPHFTTDVARSGRKEAHFSANAPQEAFISVITTPSTTLLDEREPQDIFTNLDLNASNTLKTHSWTSISNELKNKAWLPVADFLLAAYVVLSILLLVWLWGLGYIDATLNVSRLPSPWERFEADANPCAQPIFRSERRQRFQRTTSPAARAPFSSPTSSIPRRHYHNTHHSTPLIDMVNAHLLLPMAPTPRGSVNTTRTVWPGPDSVRSARSPPSEYLWTLSDFLREEERRQEQEEARTGMASRTHAYGAPV